MSKETGLEQKEKEHKAKVLVLGEFHNGDIVAELIGREMPKNPELTAKIEEIWAPKAAKGYFPGPLVRLEKFNLTPDGKLTLTLGKTDFKEYVGSRSLDSLRKSKEMPLVPLMPLVVMLIREKTPIRKPEKLISSTRQQEKCWKKPE